MAPQDPVCEQVLTARERRRMQREFDASVLGLEGLLDAYSQGSMAAFAQLARERGMFAGAPEARAKAGEPPA